MSSSKDDKKGTKEKKEEDKAPPADWESDFTKVLAHLKSDLLSELLEANSVKVAKSAKKEKMIEQVMKTAAEHGDKEFLGALDKDEFKAALEALGEKIEHDSKTKMAASFKKKYQDAKDNVSFFKKMPTAVLQKFCERLGFKEEGDASDLPSALAEEILILGLRKSFEQLKKEFATDVCKALDIRSTGSKEELINRIIGQSYSYLLESEKEAKTKDKKAKKTVDPNRKPIGPDSTFQDLYQYYLEELQEYAQKNNIRKSGSKKDVIARILTYLKGDKESIASVQPLKPGERTKKKKKGGRKSEKSKEEKDAEEKKVQDKILAIKRKRADEFLKAKGQPEAKKARK